MNNNSKKKNKLEILDQIESVGNIAVIRLSGTEKLVQLATTSALKQTIPFDINHVDRAEILAIVNGNLSGRIQGLT
jgi:hypothetical protein